MRAYLLGTPEGNRNRILWRAIVEGGYRCAAVKSASEVGDSGSAWRANCGDSQIFWISVDEFSRFSVAPMPYGDFEQPVVPAPEVVPVTPDE